MEPPCSVHQKASFLCECQLALSLMKPLPTIPSWCTLLQSTLSVPLHDPSGVTSCLCRSFILIGAGTIVGSAFGWVGARFRPRLLLVYLVVGTVATGLQLVLLLCIFFAQNRVAGAISAESNLSAKNKLVPSSCNCSCSCSTPEHQSACLSACLAYCQTDLKS